MRTNIVIDDTLMRDTLDVADGKTKREAVEEAMRAFVQLKRRKQLRELRGIGWIGDLDEMRRD